ncbi:MULTISPECIES: DUF6041 domain-containing protein [unclassified Streptomyces]|uniref:DUF6041 domain-containing protein n=1 Tax=unclassified Streptomyces TaxID=2593676 RepID=UPI0035DBE880
MTGRTLILQRVVGALYILAGIGKFFPQLESVEGRLDDASEANRGTVISDPVDWLARHPTGVMWFVALAMVAAGLALLWNRRALVIAALYGQLLMLVLFVVILVSSVPQILVLDAAFFAAAIHLLHRYHASGRATAAAPTDPTPEAR